MIFSWNCSVVTHTHTHTHSSSPFFLQLTTTVFVQCQSEKLTFRDLPVVCESSAQWDCDRGQVGHGVAVAVHPAVPTRADRLWGQAGAVEARVRHAPHCCSTIATVTRSYITVKLSHFNVFRSSVEDLVASCFLILGCQLCTWSGTTDGNWPLGCFWHIFSNVHQYGLSLRNLLD